MTVTNDATDPVGQSASGGRKDTLPQGFRYIEAVDTEPGPDGFQCSYAAGVTTAWRPVGRHPRPPGRAIGQTRTITIRRFAANTPSGGVTTPTRPIVDPDNTIPEGNEFNNRRPS